MSHFYQQELKVIVGLGNIGKNYDGTRHNVGFEIIEAFADKYQIELGEDKKVSAIAGKKKIQVGESEHEVVLVMPTTYMNNSGLAVSKILNWFKLSPSSLLVIHDEVAIDLGKIRVSKDRGAGGNHGIESIINHIGPNFSRVRLGIGPDPGGDIRADYVLGKFNNKDKKIFAKVADMTVEAIEMLLNSPIEDVMTKYNGIEVSA